MEGARARSELPRLLGRIACGVTATLGVRLSADEERTLANERPVAPQSYLSYLKGRRQLSEGTEASSRAALASFEESCVGGIRDPRPHAAVVEASIALMETGCAADRDQLAQQARAELERASEIDAADPKRCLPRPKWPIVSTGRWLWPKAGCGSCWHFGRGTGVRGCGWRNASSSQGSSAMRLPAPTSSSSGSRSQRERCCAPDVCCISRGTTTQRCGVLGRSGPCAGLRCRPIRSRVEPGEEWRGVTLRAREECGKHLGRARARRSWSPCSVTRRRLMVALASTVARRDSSSVAGRAPLPSCGLGILSAAFGDTERPLDIGTPTTRRWGSRSSADLPGSAARCRCSWTPPV